MEGIHGDASCVVCEQALPDLCRVILASLGELVGPPCGPAMYGGSRSDDFHVAKDIFFCVIIPSVFPLFY